MMPMFLSVFRSGSEQNATEVPITPETLCRDVVEFCKEPGEGECYLAQAWRSSERMVGEKERMVEVLQQWGQRRAEVRYRLRQLLPGPAGSRAADPVLSGTRVDASVERRAQNGASPARLGAALSQLQDLAAWQQQQISSQQQLLASKEQQLRSLKEQQEQQEEQEQQEQEHLRLLQEKAHLQEAKLRRVRALRGRVETTRLSNSRLVEEIQQMSQLFQQKQAELLLAVSRVEALHLQLDALRSSRLEAPPPRRSSSAAAAELERLCRELQLKSRGDQEQSEHLQRQRSLEAAATERRLAELRQRLWRRKARPLPQRPPAPADPGPPQVGSGGGAAQRAAPSRVAAVGPYIRAGAAQPPQTPSKDDPPTAASGLRASTLPRASGPGRPASDAPVGGPLLAPPSGPDRPPPVPSRTRNPEDLLTEQQAPPPAPPFSTGTFPGKRGAQRRAPGPPSCYSSTLPLPGKPDKPPAAAVRPYTPELDPPPPLQRPPTVAASSIYSMYTQQGAPAKSFPPGGQGSLPRRPRVYGKPVLPAGGGQPPGPGAGGDASGADPDGAGAEQASPRPLSPTKLLPFLSHPHGKASEAELEALRRRLHRAPRPLKKRSSITEPEGPAGPAIQKLLYQKTTLAAMETGPADTPPQAGEDAGLGDEDGRVTPPPVSSLAPDPAPLEDGEEEEEEEDRPPPPPPDEFPPYPPPPYPACGRSQQEGDVTDPPPPEGAVPPGRKSILRRSGSEPPDPGARVRFSPLALLLDASLEGEYDLVQRVIYEVDDPSAPNDEGITALHNAVCAGHADIVKFLVQFGVDANAADSDGWTPLHCAASCNNLALCRFLVDSGAAVFAATHSDLQTAADKCEETEDGYAQCSQFLYGAQQKMGVMNRGVVYALWDRRPRRDDELRFGRGDCLTVLRREEPAEEEEWWWARCGDHEGYVPRNLLGLYPRVRPRQRSLA